MMALPPLLQGVSPDRENGYGIRLPPITDIYDRRINAPLCLPIDDTERKGKGSEAANRGGLTSLALPKPQSQRFR
jgi:hypothetical protein